MSQPLLPAGTIIHITVVARQHGGQQVQPEPANWVGYGQRTIDEMSFAWVSLFYIDEAEYQQRIERAKAETTNE